ncbi:MAG: type II secretion system protein N [Polaromonas sp.]
MQTDAHRLWFTRIVTFTVSALAAASVAYWGLKSWQPQAATTTPTVVIAQASSGDPQALARALGGGPAPLASLPQAPPVSSRYVLVGVLAGNSRSGAALISVDGQEARPVRVGTLVVDDVRLFSVTARHAVLTSGAATPEKFTLELPPLDN